MVLSDQYLVRTALTALRTVPRRSGCVDHLQAGGAIHKATSCDLYHRSTVILADVVGSTALDWGGPTHPAGMQSQESCSRFHVRTPDLGDAHDRSFSWLWAIGSSLQAQWSACLWQVLQCVNSRFLEPNFDKNLCLECVPTACPSLFCIQPRGTCLTMTRGPQPVGDVLQILHGHHKIKR